MTALDFIVNFCFGFQSYVLWQRCTTFLGQGPQSIIFSALLGRRQNHELNFRESSIKNQFLYLTKHFIAGGLILLPSVLFRIVIRLCKIVNSSMKSKFIHKISVIQEKFLVFVNLLWGPDVTRSGGWIRPVGCRLCIPVYRMPIEFLSVFILTARWKCQIWMCIGRQYYGAGPFVNIN